MLDGSAVERAMKHAMEQRRASFLERGCYTFRLIERVVSRCEVVVQRVGKYCAAQ